MNRLTHDQREWLTESILGWKKTIEVGVDPAHSDSKSVTYVVWITESGTHQFLPTFNDSSTGITLLEKLKNDGYTVTLESFELPHMTTGAWWECVISKNDTILSKTQDRELTQVIIKACLLLEEI